MSDSIKSSHRVWINDYAWFVVTLEDGQPTLVEKREVVWSCDHDLTANKMMSQRVRKAIEQAQKEAAEAKEREPDLLEAAKEMVSALAMRDIPSFIGKRSDREAGEMSDRPHGSNADEWHLFLTDHLDNRANSPNGLTYMAVQIAEALDEAQERGRQLYELSNRAIKKAEGPKEREPGEEG